MPEPSPPLESLRWLVSFCVTRGVTWPFLPRYQRVRISQNPSQGQVLAHLQWRLKHRRTHTLMSAMRRYH
jgi:hypothetical protein